MAMPCLSRLLAKGLLICFVFLLLKCDMANNSQLVLYTPNVWLIYMTDDDRRTEKASQPVQVFSLSFSPFP